MPDATARVRLRPSRHDRALTPIAVPEPLIQPPCIRVVQTHAQRQDVVTTLARRCLTCADQHRADSAPPQPRRDFQVIEHGYARIDAPQLGLLLDLAIEVDITDDGAVEPRDQQHTGSLPGAADPVDEEFALSHRGYERIQVTLVGDPDLQALRRIHRPRHAVTLRSPPTPKHSDSPATARYLAHHGRRAIPRAPRSSRTPQRRSVSRTPVKPSGSTAPLGITYTRTALIPHRSADRAHPRRPGPTCPRRRSSLTAAPGTRRPRP